MKVVAFVGDSGSGKTTAIATLIRNFVNNGERVGAIKHTHHVLNEEDRGDTAEFRRCGADPVILAGDGDAVLFRGTQTDKIAFSRPEELLKHFDTDVLFIEGFKSVDSWPRIELNRVERRSPEALLSDVDRIWRS